MHRAHFRGHTPSLHVNPKRESAALQSWVPTRAHRHQECSFPHHSSSYEYLKWCSSRKAYYVPSFVVTFNAHSNPENYQNSLKNSFVLKYLWFIMFPFGAICLHKVDLINRNESLWYTFVHRGARGFMGQAGLLPSSCSVVHSPHITECGFGSSLALFCEDV